MKTIPTVYFQFLETTVLSQKKEFAAGNVILLGKYLYKNFEVLK